MEIKGETPKEIQYIHTLLNHFSQSWTRRIKNKLVNGDDTYTRSELAEILDGNKRSDYAYQFLNKLIEEDVLEHAGKKKTASSPADTYRYTGNKELIKAFHETDYYQENRDLFVDTLKKAENKELI